MSFYPRGIPSYKYISLQTVQTFSKLPTLCNLNTKYLNKESKIFYSGRREFGCGPEYFFFHDPNDIYLVFWAVPGPHLSVGTNGPDNEIHCKKISH